MTSAPSGPAYDVFQQTFRLSILANSAWTDTGTQPELLAKLTAAVTSGLNSQAEQALIGKWSVAWGPQVWQNTGSSVADNAMYVAYNPAVKFADGLTHEAYVVAIAATGPFSTYDWLTEDFDVSSVVAFDTFNPLQPAPTPAPTPVSPTTAVISMGTAIGVSNLLKMTSPNGAPAAGQSLAQFLGSLKGNNKAVIFTGHSLAGALSPTVGLWLKKNKYLAGFGPDGTYHFVYATAGATPGNLAFASEFSSHFVPNLKPPANSYKVWNRQVWNTLDVVPHAWNLDLLSKVPKLYGNPNLDAIDAAVALAAANAARSKVYYVHTAEEQLTGTLTGPVSTTLEFLKQAAYQHTTAYGALIAAGPSGETLDVPEERLVALAAALEAKAPQEPATADA